MKVESSPTKLVLYSRPWGLWLLAASLPIFGLPVLITTFQIHSLTCKRTEQAQGICEISHRTAFQTTSQQIPLSKLKEARVQESINFANTNAVLLTTDAKEIPLRSAFDNFDSQGKQNTVSRINAFLQNPQESTLTVHQYSELLPSLFGLGWNGCALYFFFYGCQITTCTFDKTVKTFRITRKSLLGNKTTEYPLDQIIDVNIHKASIVAYKGISAVPITPVSIKLASGEFIGIYRDVGFRNREKNAEHIAELICEFLNLSSNC